MRRAGIAATHPKIPASYRSAAAAEHLQLALSQEVVSSSANALHLLREHRSLFTSRSLVMHSTGSAALEPLSGAPCSAISTVSAAAVSAVLKCLPFELPSLTVAPVDTDRNRIDSTDDKYTFAAVPSKLENWCVLHIQLPKSIICRRPGDETRQ